MSDTPRTDAILALLPGGQTCDPQLVADELRLPVAELEREIAAERALSDRLAKVIERWRQLAGFHFTPLIADEALAAWKGARNGTD